MSHVFKRATWQSGTWAEVHEAAHVAVWVHPPYDHTSGEVAEKLGISALLRLEILRIRRNALERIGRNLRDDHGGVAVKTITAARLLKVLQPSGNREPAAGSP